LSARPLALLALLGAGCIDFDPLDRCTRAPCTSCVAAITAGWTHTCALKGDGSLWCWGNNNAGQLARQDVPSSALPSGIAGLPPAERASAGDSFTCAIVSNGLAYCWGYDDSGQLGDGAVAAGVPTPAVVDGLGEVPLVATGSSHACAVHGDGTLSCWGSNDHGQLGDGTTNQQLMPVPVAFLGGAVEAAAGFYHTCALASDGTVRCWGDNSSGQLGDGSTNNRMTASLPVAIDGVAHIAAGHHHSCAIKRDGTLWCWGANGQGQLGDGSTVDRPTPVQVEGLAGVTAVALNGFDAQGSLGHTCAIAAGGRLWCWGSNRFGELGDGSTDSHATPQEIPTLVGSIAVAAGAKHSCAVRAEGAVYCWGADDVGQLGDGVLGQSTSPSGTMLSCP
jgi:alpha-tubulin suppressor-like RCC1 family protein